MSTVGRGRQARALQTTLGSMWPTLRGADLFGPFAEATLAALTLVVSSNDLQRFLEGAEYGFGKRTTSAIQRALQTAWETMWLAFRSWVLISLGPWPRLHARRWFSLCRRMTCSVSGKSLMYPVCISSFGIVVGIAHRVRDEICCACKSPPDSGPRMQVRAKRLPR